MTHPRSPFLIISIGILLCSGFANAQTAPTEAQDTNAELRTRAFALLDSVAGEIPTLQSAENRARLGSNIAALLWNHDEKRARSLLVGVQSDINAGLQNLDENNGASTQTLMVFFHLRVDTVARISRYDADLALEFFKATEPTSSDKPLPSQFAEMERQLELKLANQIAAQSPEVALKIARNILKRGFSYELQSLLRQLNRKHKEQAMVLYKAIVAKFRDTDFLEDHEAFYLALQLARSFKPPSVDASPYRELINLLIDGALANGCGNKQSAENENRWFCYEVGTLFREMQSTDPSRAAKLTQWAPEEGAERQWPSEQYAEALAELNDLSEDASVDQILALIPKYPQMTNQIYRTAMAQAMNQGDIERARKIVTDYETNPEARQRILSRIDAVEKQVTLNEDTLAEIQRQIAQIPGALERTMMLMNFANQIGTKDRKSALKLLDQAREIIESMKPGREQTLAQMRLATMYCQEKSDRGLDLIESLMPKLNDLVAAAVKLDGYENHHLREGEWNMSNEGTLGQLLTNLSENAAYFSWCDFDRAVGVAAQFERPELRLMARMKLAQGILAGPPKRDMTVASPYSY